MWKQTYVHARVRKLLVSGAIWAGCLLALLPLQASAQQKNTEHWLGTLKVGPSKLRLQLNLTQDDSGNYSGEMVSVDQGPDGSKMDEVTLDDDVLKFKIKKIRVSFEGKLNKDRTLAKGVFTQGQKFDVEFKRVKDVKPDKHIQSWTGVMDAHGKKFDFQFRVFLDGERKKFIKLDSFSESLMGIPGEYAEKDKTLTFKIPATRAKFVGDLSEDGKVIDGNWIQGGGEFPLELKLIPLEQTRSLDLKRPQTPKAPFDYDVSEFSVSTQSKIASAPADVELAGTLTMPKGSGPFATVILISGSGPQDRNETIFEHRPFFVIADHLTRNGFAVIRFDDRGVGQSKGDFSSGTSADFADDAEALLKWAQDQPKLNSKQVVLAGHSEGGLIAPMVAARNADVAGVIMLAGPGVTGKRIVLNQTRLIGGVAGMPEQVLDMQDRMLTTMIERMESGKPIDDDFKKDLSSSFDGLDEDKKEAMGLEDVADTTVATMNSPWMKYFLVHDPAPSLVKTKCPILSLIGGKDLQVDPNLNAPAIEAAVKQGGNSDFVQKVLPGLNHLFQDSKTGSPSEYIQIEETMSPVVLDEMTQWMKKRFH